MIEASVAPRRMLDCRPRGRFRWKTKGGVVLTVVCPNFTGVSPIRPDPDGHEGGSHDNERNLDIQVGDVRDAHGRRDGVHGGLLLAGWRAGWLGESENNGGSPTTEGCKLGYISMSALGADHLIP